MATGYSLAGRRNVVRQRVQVTFLPGRRAWSDFRATPQFGQWTLMTAAMKRLLVSRMSDPRAAFFGTFPRP
jgi:hypothetical protein